MGLSCQALSLKIDDKQLMDLNTRLQAMEMSLRTMSHEFEHLLIRVAKLEGLE
jgi:hypothetical protein